MTARSASVQAQGKINLFLRIVAHESSGYHQLETLFARIDLADSITVHTDTSVRELNVVGADTGHPALNLATRAVTAFAESCGWPRGFKIDIEKRIPVGGGLGGGSADAGAVLRALNALAPNPFPQDELLRIAFTLGADVPFLTTESPLSLAWGRGERMLALPALPARELLLCLPPFGVSTAEAFGWVSGVRHSAASVELARLADWAGVKTLVYNDFQAIVGAIHPEIWEALNLLNEAGADIAMMTGSGSTVFGVFESGIKPEVTSMGFPKAMRLVRSMTADSVSPVKLLD